MNVRSRRELSTRDAANVRQFEHWQTDAPYLQMDRPDLSGQYVLNDMNPIDSRTQDSRLYFQNQMFTAGQDQFTQNSYFQGYAPEYDSRNAIRELRSVVFENRFDKGMKESKRLLARSFTNTWEEKDYVEKNNLDSLKAYENLRPQMDDISKGWRMNTSK